MVNESPVGHEQVCLPCWLTALGIDRDLGAAIIGAAFRAGQMDGLMQLTIPPADAQAFLGPAVVLTPQVGAAVIAQTQRVLAVPVSAEVAQAMRGGH